MNMDYVLRPWLDSAQALDYLQQLTGIAMTDRELLGFCEDERCRAYVDCAFAAGPAPDNQLFIDRIKGAGHCALLESGNMTLAVPEGGEELRLCVNGRAIVQGTAWVYPRDGGHPVKEEGFWLINLRAPLRALYFKPADIQALVASLNDSPRPGLRRRNSRA